MQRRSLPERNLCALPRRLFLPRTRRLRQVPVRFLPGMAPETWYRQAGPFRWVRLSLRPPRRRRWRRAQRMPPTRTLWRGRGRSLPVRQRPLDLRQPRVLAQPVAERPAAEQPVTQAPTATPEPPEAARAVPEGAEPQIRASEKPAAAALQSVSGADPARPVPAPVAPAMPQAEVVEQRPLASVDPVLTPKQAADASPAFAFARRVAAQLHGHNFEEGKTRVELTPRGLGDIEVEVAHDDQGKLLDRAPRREPGGTDGVPQ